MKKLLLLSFSLIGILFFQGCEGPEGPPGVNIVAEVFEEGVNFTASNNYSAQFNFIPPINDSDVVLVFILWETDNGNSVWRALPQTIFFENGAVLIYNFDFTRNDYRIFLDGAINPETLGEDFRLNQVFRVLVVPGDFANGRVDLTDYEAVTAMLALKDEDFKRIGF